MVYGTYRPTKVVAVGLPNDQGVSSVPLLAGGEQLGERATAYVCQRFACQQPVNTARDLAAQLHTPWQE